jgi:aromatic-L-amino-acid decarboxylase
MNSKEFRKFGHKIIDQIADYYDNIENFPVFPDVSPGEILNKLPAFPPENGEPFDDILKDIDDKIMPGITHWQHPGFFAYFPSNTSFESILGELITSALGPITFSWQTSPAAAELEELTMNWLKNMLSIPNNFHGVIQDTASTATLVSLLTAREKLSNYNINKAGSSYSPNFRVYASTEIHSSIDKAVKIAGIGIDNLVKINTDENFSMDVAQLESAIKKDLMQGKTPMAIVAAIGTTSSTAVDPIEDIANLADKYGIWLHIDAAYSGSALILPEYKHLLKGIEKADTFVMNPHKWLFTNFDCSAYYVKDKKALINTFTMMPEYLKTNYDDKVNNYKDWGIQLGRRFRALKLWMVLRSFGVKGLQEKLRFHIELSKEFEQFVADDSDFEIAAPRNFNLVCFRLKLDNHSTNENLDLNKKLLDNINSTGKIFLTHTELNGLYTIRFVIGKTYVERKHLDIAIDIIKEEKNKIIKSL